MQVELCDREQLHENGSAAASCSTPAARRSEKSEANFADPRGELVRGSQARVPVEPDGGMPERHRDDLELLVEAHLAAAAGL